MVSESFLWLPISLWFISCKCTEKRPITLILINLKTHNISCARCKIDAHFVKNSLISFDYLKSYFHESRDSKVTMCLMSAVTKRCEPDNFDNMKKDSAGGYFNGKIPAAICWSNEMAGAGRRSGWPLTNHTQHMPRRRVEVTTSPLLMTISNLIIIKTSSVTFINPTMIWIFKDLRNRAHHMLPLCTSTVSRTKTGGGN